MIIKSISWLTFILLVWLPLAWSAPKPTATISPATIKIKVGDRVTFSNKGTNKDVRHYWLLGKQVGQKSSFSPNTKQLSIGKHRIRLTVTTADKQQAHAQAFITVTGTPISGNSAVTAEEIVTVPDLRGKTRSAARRALQKIGLSLGRTSYKPGTLKKGLILSQNIVANSEALQGSPVDVVVSNKKTDIPDESEMLTPAYSLDDVDEETQDETLADPDENDATVEIEAETEEAETDDNIEILPDSVVISESDETEIEEVADNAKVEFDVNSNETISSDDTNTAIETETEPEPLNKLALEVIPSMQSVTQGDAAVFKNKYADQITGARYTWSVRNFKGSDARFKVETKDLAPGKYAVDAEISREGEAIISDAALLEVRPLLNRRVPNLNGLEVSQAMRVLLEEGLKVGTIKQKEQADLKKSVVVEQSIKAGKVVKVGQLVDLTEGVPEEPSKKTSKVTLKVSRSYIEQGESVKLTASIEPKQKDDSGTDYLFIIDGKQHIVSDPYLDWKFDTEGSFPIQVLARNKEGALSESIKLRVNVTKAWQAPVAKILPETLTVKQGDEAEFSSTSTYAVQGKLTYDWQSETKDTGKERRFSFATKDLKPGEYTITLNVVDNKDMQASTTAKLVVSEADAAPVVAVVSDDKTKTPTSALTTNATSATQVDTPEPKPAPVATINGKPISPASENHDNTPIVRQATGEPNLMLNLSDRYARAGDEVQVGLNSDIAHSDALFSFEMGDGTKTDWLPSNQLKHVYDSFGRYKITAGIRMGGREYFSRPKSVWVWSPTLFGILGGVGSALLALLWWWTGRVPKAHKVYREDMPYKNKVITSDVVLESAIPKSAPEPLVTDYVQEEEVDNDRITLGRIFKLLLQFIIGITFALALMVLFTN